jgi:hypothetical protein
MVSKHGHYKRYMILGALFLLAGIFLLSRMGEGADVTQVAWRMFVAGLGLGPAQSLFSTVAQNSAPEGQLGVVIKGRLLRVKFAKVNGEAQELPQPPSESHAPMEAEEVPF